MILQPAVSVCLGLSLKCTHIVAATGITWFHLCEAFDSDSVKFNDLGQECKFFDKNVKACFRPKNISMLVVCLNSMDKPVNMTIGF